MMKSILILLPIAATVVATALEQSAEDPILGVSTIHGCYSSVGELQLNGTNEFNSQGLCAANCEDTGAYVAAAQGDACYCGNKYPPASTLVDDSQCDEPCPGFGMDACGGSKAFTIINTGVMSKVDDSTDDSSGSEAAASSSASSVTSASTTVASVASTGPGTAITNAPTGSGSTATTSPTSSTSVTSGSGSASASSSGAAGTSGAVSQVSLNGLHMAMFCLGTALMM